MPFSRLPCLLSQTRCSSALIYECKKCNVFRPPHAFYKHVRRKVGIDTSTCKQCRYDLKCTPAGYFAKLVNQAKYHQKMRYRKKGIDCPPFALTKEFIRTLYKKQNGRGYYSNTPMILRPLSDWQVSLERLDPNADYVDGNVVLDTLEFNSRCQWTLEKVIQIPSLIHSRTSNITMDVLSYSETTPKKEKWKKPPAKIADGKYYCYYCHQWLSFASFYGASRLQCKSCRQQVINQNNKTLRGFLVKLLLNAKHHSYQKPHSIRNSEMNLSRHLMMYFDCCFLKGCDVHILEFQ